MFRKASLVKNFDRSLKQTKLCEYVWFSLHYFIMFIVHRSRLYFQFFYFCYIKFAYNKNVKALNFAERTNLGNYSIIKCACIRAAEKSRLGNFFFQKFYDQSRYLQVMPPSYFKNDVMCLPVTTCIWSDGTQIKLHYSTYKTCLYNNLWLK